MTYVWVLFALVCAIMICTIVIASLVKCYYSKKLEVEKEIRKSDEEIVSLLKKLMK